MRRWQDRRQQRRENEKLEKLLPNAGTQFHNITTPDLPGIDNNEYQMDPDDFAELQSLPGNTACVDCGSPHPDWGSPKLGVLFCFKCSGMHRALGTHLSFVRSVTLDSWSTAQMDSMRAGGGNQACIDYLSQRGVDMSVPYPHGTTSLAYKYDTSAAELWRQVLKARVEGRPEPTELPTPAPGDRVHLKQGPTVVKVDPKRLQGFGSSPPPPSSSTSTTDLVKIAVVTTAVVVGATLYFVAPH